MTDISTFPFHEEHYLNTLGYIPVEALPTEWNDAMEPVISTPKASANNTPDETEKPPVRVFEHEEIPKGTGLTIICLTVMLIVGSFATYTGHQHFINQATTMQGYGSQQSIVGNGSH